MDKYLARSCPKCRGYLSIVIVKPYDDNLQSIRGHCATRAYEIAWALIRIT
jgi:hypothetical protein